MTGKSTVIYSSSLVIVLLSLSSLLMSYLAEPQTIDMTELKEISRQLEDYTHGATQDIIVPTKINTLMGWWYPGPPACGALDTQKIKFDVLKPEYFAVRDNGKFEFMSADNYVCNGYSTDNIKLIKAVSNEQYVMISSSYAKDMEKFLLTDEVDTRYTKQVVDFVVENDFTGAELDFEDYGGWTPEIYELYKSFIERLGSSLQSNGKKLMIDLPPVRNVVEEQWYTFRLTDFEKLPVDYILVMGYDYQFDHGVGEPVAPLTWLEEVILFTRNRLTDDKKIIVGVPSYGYLGDKQSGQIKILTKEQARQEALFGRAVRDSSSSEFIAESATQVLVYQDDVSVQAKINVVEKMGIDKVSIWHLGGNPLPRQ